MFSIDFALICGSVELSAVEINSRAGAATIVSAFTTTAAIAVVAAAAAASAVCSRSRALDATLDHDIAGARKVDLLVVTAEVAWVFGGGGCEAIVTLDGNGRTAEVGPSVFEGL